MAVATPRRREPGLHDLECQFSPISPAPRTRTFAWLCSRLFLAEETSSRWLPGCPAPCSRPCTTRSRRRRRRCPTGRRRRRLAGPRRGEVRVVDRLRAVRTAVVHPDAPLTEVGGDALLQPVATVVGPTATSAVPPARAPDRLRSSSYPAGARPSSAASSARIAATSSRICSSEGESPVRDRLRAHDDSPSSGRCSSTRYSYRSPTTPAWSTRHHRFSA